MKARDPLDRARILARFDRVTEAIADLRKALSEDPTRADIRQELAELELRQMHSSGVGAAKHKLAAWMYLLGSYAIVFSPLYVLLRFGEDQINTMSFSGLQGGFKIGGGIVALIVMILAAQLLFLRLWFRRLVRLPAAVQPHAEAALAQTMAMYALEPQYSRLRARLIGGNDA